MPSTFTFEEAASPSTSKSSFSFEEAQSAPKKFSFEEAKTFSFEEAKAPSAPAVADTSTFPSRSSAAGAHLPAPDPRPVDHQSQPRAHFAQAIGQAAASAGEAALQAAGGPERTAPAGSGVVLEVTPEDVAKTAPQPGDMDGRVLGGVPARGFDPVGATYRGARDFIDFAKATIDPIGETQPGDTVQSAMERRRAQIAADRAKTHADAQLSGYVRPATTEGGKVAEGLTQGIVATAPLMAATAPLQIAKGAGEIARRSVQAIGAGERVAGAAGGVAGATAGAAEFGGVMGTMEAAKTGDANAILKGLALPAEQVGRIAKGEGTVDDYVNVLLTIGAGALGALRARQPGAAQQPAQPQPTKGTTGLSPEAQAFVNNIPEGSLAAIEQRLARGGEGSAAMLEAVRARRSGKTTPGGVPGSSKLNIPEQPSGAQPRQPVREAATPEPPQGTDVAQTPTIRRGYDLYREALSSKEPAAFAGRVRDLVDPSSPAAVELIKEAGDLPVFVSDGMAADVPADHVRINETGQSAIRLNRQRPLTEKELAWAIGHEGAHEIRQRKGRPTADIQGIPHEEQVFEKSADRMAEAVSGRKRGEVAAPVAPQPEGPAGGRPVLLTDADAGIASEGAAGRSEGQQGQPGAVEGGVAEDVGANAPAAKAPAAKQPWEMTLGDYKQSRGVNKETIDVARHAVDPIDSFIFKGEKVVGKEPSAYTYTNPKTGRSFSFDIIKTEKKLKHRPKPDIVRYIATAPNSDVPIAGVVYNTGEQAVVQMFNHEGRIGLVQQLLDRVRRDFGRVEAADPMSAQGAKAIHRNNVAAAMREGRLVSPAVLADYPDLASKSAKQPPAKAPVTDVEAGVKTAVKPPKKYTKPEIDTHLEKAMQGEMDDLEVFRVQMESASAALGEGTTTEAMGSTIPAMFSETFKSLTTQQKRAVKAMGVVVNDDIAQSQIEMIGDKPYDAAIEAVIGRGDKEKRIRSFAQRVVNEPGRFDEETRLRAYMRAKWDDMTLQQRQRYQTIVNPKELPEGTTLTIRGEEFTVQHDNGETKLKDGITLNVGGMTEVPVDVGSVRRPASKEQTYEEATEIFRAASREFNKARDDYRARKIGDDEFIAARKKLDEAGKVHDVAMAKEAARKPEPKPEKTSGQQLGLLGDKTAGGITSKKSGDLFSAQKQADTPLERRPDPTPAELRRGETEEDRVIREKWEKVGGTENLFGAKPGDIDPKSKIDLGDTEGAQPLESAVKLLTGTARSVGEATNFLTGQMINPLRGRSAGEVIIRALDDIESKKATLVGKVENDAVDAYKGLTREDKKWMEKLDSDGFSNIQKLMEDTGAGRLASPNPRIDRWVAAYQKMLDITGDEAVAKKIQRVDAKGNIVPFTKAKTGRFLRHFTDDAQQAIIYKSGPLYEAVAREVARLNSGVTLAQAKAYLNEYLGPEAIRKVGSLEDVRTVKNLPTAVELNPGKGDWVAILENDPLQAIMGAAESQARRIYFAEKFGQGLKGQKTRIDRLRARFVEQGGNPLDIDNVLEVFHHRPFKRVFKNPRNAFARTGRVLSQIASSLQTSLSVLPNIPQTAMTAEVVGLRNWIKGLVRVVRHPRTTAAQMAAMGAMHRSAMEWTIRKGHVPEDFTKILTGLISRATGLHWIAQLNNMVAAAQGDALASSLAMHGVKAGDRRLLKELRLNPDEIRAVESGKMTPEIHNKIVQNTVKLTQFITEDPQRRAMLQNIPLLGSLFSYNNYIIGTTKKMARRVTEFAQAAASGSQPEIRRSARRIVLILSGMLGAGLVGRALRDAKDGKEVMPKSMEELKGKMLNAMVESAILGPAQRILDAERYSRSGKDFILAFTPKLRFLADILDRGLAGGIKKNTPLWKWLDPDKK